MPETRRPRNLREEFFNLPNVLTMARIAFIPAVIIAMHYETPRACIVAAILYGVATITDFFDGWLARRRNLVTMVGKFFDPLADKLIVMATMVMFVAQNWLAAWVVIVLLAREIFITTLRAVASSEGIIIAAGQGGKWKTAIQMLATFVLLIHYRYPLDFIVWRTPPADFAQVGRILIYASVFFSIHSAWEYLRDFVVAIDPKRR